MEYQKKKYSQKGFSVVEGLLILIIVGLIGGTGWYVLHAHKNSTTKKQSVASSPTNSPDTSSQNSIVGRRAEDVANHLLVAETSYHDIKNYVNNLAVGNWFTDGFKAAVNNGMEWPASGHEGQADPISCGNGIVPDSFKANKVTITGDKAVVSLHFISYGADSTTADSLLLPQATLVRVSQQYLGNNWLLDSYKCVKNPAS